MNRYIYKLESIGGKTYIGQRVFSGDDVSKDKYLGSSTWFKRYSELDEICFKTILIQNVKDDFTLSLLETIAIMDDIAENGHLENPGYFNRGNVNGNLGGYQHNNYFLNNMLGVETRKKKNSYVMKEISKKKMSETKRRNNALLSEEERKKKYGHKFTEETKKKMSESHKGKIPWNKGKTFIK